MMDRLVDRIKKLEAPIVVGLDPTLAILPKFLLQREIKERGETLEAAAEAVWHFNKGIIDAVSDLIPAVKPQIAMYEQFGIPGLIVYKRTIDYCKEKGLIVIGDCKRGDIGTSSEAYAVGHLGKVRIGRKMLSGFDEDFLTVNPYLGTDGVMPFVEVCRKEKKGIFVLVKTSNESSGEFQDQEINERRLYECVADKVDEWGENLMGKTYSYVGAVIGATYPRMARELRNRIPKTFFLVPAYGAQGATAKDVKEAFHKDGTGAIVNSSRGIIAAYKLQKYQSFGDEGFGSAAREAVLHMKKDIISVLN
ncbi:MAG: orotidine-5'-phosphate decarboxylase [Lachnoclostridium sp.]|jgi:orotidine-5'-phosphate decarboxylase|nr:orotidine-5'-phosphate decarboxylase [Lachnoclostridium sp.]